jgi:DNA-binding NarL/FixJ family response regulator
MATRSDPCCGAPPARLVIAEDHPLVRAGLRSMLAGEPDLEIVGEAATGQQAVEPCCSLHPDLVLMDLRMPEMDGLTATRVIEQQCPTTRVLILTISEERDLISEARQAGAAGYLLKDASQPEVVTAIQKALQQEMLFDHEATP